MGDRLPRDLGLEGQDDLRVRRAPGLDLADAGARASHTPSTRSASRSCTPGSPFSWDASTTTRWRCSSRRFRRRRPCFWRAGFAGGARRLRFASRPPRRCRSSSRSTAVSRPAWPRSRSPSFSSSRARPWPTRSTGTPGRSDGWRVAAAGAAALKNEGLFAAAAAALLAVVCAGACRGASAGAWPPPPSCPPSRSSRRTGSCAARSRCATSISACSALPELLVPPLARSANDRVRGRRAGRARSARPGPAASGRAAPRPRETAFSRSRPFRSRPTRSCRPSASSGRTGSSEPPSPGPPPPSPRSSPPASPSDSPLSSKRRRPRIGLPVTNPSGGSTGSSAGPTA